MWQMLLLISFFCLSVLTYGQQSPKPPPPQITNFLKHDLINPEQVKFRKENALILPCGAIGSNLKWSWKHNDTLIPDGELQFGKRRLGNDGTLTGSNLGITDGGSYQCFVKDTETNVQTFSRKIQVAVTVVGDFTDAGKNDWSQQVTLGRTDTFKCPAHFPSNLVDYSWTGKGIKIQLQMNERRAITPNGDLVILFVTLEDVNDIKGLGGIQCTMSAANTFYPSGALTLTVPPGQTDPETLFAPTWIEFPASIEKAIEGRNKTLHCLAVGRPAPKITWKLNGRVLVHGKDSMEIPKAFNGRQLIIVKVQREFHEDTYTCEAENSQGSAPLKTTSLVVEVIPKWTSGSPPNSKETIDIYGNGTLTCDVFAIPEPTFRWYRDGEEILADTAQVTRDVNKLHFKVVRLAEAGIYQCVAENTHGMIVSSTYVHVLALPPSFEERGFGPFYLFQESEGRLKCDPDAAPRPNSYRWFKDGTEIIMTSPYRLESDGTLVISNVQRSRDAGQYKCSATNFLATAEATAEATVLDKTQITIKPQDQQVVEGTRVDLRCEATADPTLELGYYWKRDNAVIVYNSKFQWLASQNVLTIIDITVDDAGIYTCFAYTPEPKKSEDSASATIDIAGAPYPPTNLELSTDCLNRSTTLKWVTGASNNATITHFLIERLSDHANDVWRLIANVTNSNTTSVALNLTGWATLYFRVRAVNRFGPSRASLPTTSLCRTEKGVPDKWPDNFRGVPGKAEELDIVWDPMPLVEWNAPKLYYRLWYAKAPGPLAEPVKISDSTLGKFNVPDAGYYQEYQFKIQAGNEEGLGPESPLIRAFSGQDPPAGRPEDVNLGTVTARSVELSWKAVTVDRGSVDGYRIYFWGESRGISAKRRRREIPSYATFANVTGGGTQTYTVTNLRPYTNYNFALTAVNSGGEGPQSVEVFAPTEEAEPGPPSDVNVYAFAKYILVTWQAPAEPNGVITAYQVGSSTYLGSEPNDVVVNMEEVGPNVFRKLLENQEPEKNYAVKLQAKTSIGWGDEVTMTTRTVKWAAPAKPNRPTVEGTAVDKVRVDYNFGLGGGYTHEFLVMYRKDLPGEDFQNTSWVNHFETQSIEIGDLSPDLYQFKTVARNDFPNTDNRQESPASDVTEGRPLPGVVNAGKRTSTPIHKTAWFIALLVLIAILLIVLLIFVLYKRHQGAKYPVGKRERKRAALIDREPYDEEEGAFNNAGRTENPPPYQSEGSLPRGPDSDRDSLDDYGEGPQFNEDGSFIEEYGDEKKGAPDEKDPSALATFV